MFSALIAPSLTEISCFLTAPLTLNIQLTTVENGCRAIPNDSDGKGLTIERLVEYLNSLSDNVKVGSKNRFHCHQFDVFRGIFRAIRDMDDAIEGALQVNLVRQIYG